VQLWFGEFIHGVMDEAYRRWRVPQASGPLPSFPWPWKPTVFDVEQYVVARLAAKGLNPLSNLWDKTGANQLLASQRTELAINTWGKQLFPLIQEAELLLQGIRLMPRPLVATVARSDYYEIKGVVDVLSSVRLASAPTGNAVLSALGADPTCGQSIANSASGTFEVIVDYKGTRRPPTLVIDRKSSHFGQPNPEWLAYEWQVLTYAWLRSQQPGSQPVLAGILLFLNELAPSDGDLADLKLDVSLGSTDLMPLGADLQAIRNWKPGKPCPLSQQFLVGRSIRIVPVLPATVQGSLTNFDAVVQQIETSVLREMAGSGIVGNWVARPERRTCTACDFRTFCPSSAQPGPPSVP